MVGTSVWHAYVPGLTRLRARADNGMIYLMLYNQVPNIGDCVCIPRDSEITLTSVPSQSGT